MHYKLKAKNVFLTVIDRRLKSTAKVYFSIENQSNRGNLLEVIAKHPLQDLFHAKTVPKVLSDDLVDSCNDSQTIGVLRASEYLHPYQIKYFFRTHFVSVSMVSNLQISYCRSCFGCFTNPNHDIVSLNKNNRLGHAI